MAAAYIVDIVAANGLDVLVGAIRAGAVFVGVIIAATQQRLPIGDWKAVVIGVNFVEGKKPMPVAAIFDEGGLQGGFNPRNFREIDVAFELTPCGGFEIELFELVSVDDDDPRFFGMRRVDKHPLNHYISTAGGPNRSPRLDVKHRRRRRAVVFHAVPRSCKPAPLGLVGDRGAGRGQVTVWPLNGSKTVSLLLRSSPVTSHHSGRSYPFGRRRAGGVRIAIANPARARSSIVKIVSIPPVHNLFAGRDAEEALHESLKRATTTSVVNGFAH